MLIARRLELGARAAFVREDVNQSDGDRWEAGPSINWYINGHRLKIQFDYAVLIEQVPGGTDAFDNRLRLQLQGMF